MAKPVVLIAEQLSPATVEALGPDFDLVHLSEPRRLNPRLPWSHRLGIWQRR